MKINNIEVRICKGFENYAVSECGKVFNYKKEKELSVDVRVILGYPSCYVHLSFQGKAKHYKVHQLVAKEWLAPPETERHFYINHKDGNALNNHVSNLEWVTSAQNQRHAVATGLRGKGSDLYNATLSEQQVHDICKAFIDGARDIDLANKYKVSRDIIRKLRAGDTYFHIRSLYNIPHNYKHELSESTVKWVCNKILEGYSDAEIAKLSTNVGVTTIECKRIRHKIRYKLISDVYF